MEVYSLLENYGIFSFFGPFLVIFSLMYGTLRKSYVFGKVKSVEKIYIIIAFALTLYYLYNLSVIGFTQRVLSFFFYEMLALLLILIAISFLFTTVSPKEKGEEPKTSVLSGIFGLLVILAFLYASISSPSEVGEGVSSTINGILDFLVTSGLLVIIIPLFIIIAVIYWVTTPSGSGKSIKEKSRNILLITDSTLEDMIKRLQGGEQK
ncbi:MAG: hypothetical protein BXU00_03345 [Candidatus Nanoclepta minutus]|uniref:Uncharacterized protein n=1 Tax=Candidatus Nanoclepta minutus TaxID=1940235 RepID=A0A397WMF5_9ARCH|nr:MAG: hypothetical protein BXU00_03345 [Candidatus Nanoclepta minutus]